MAERRGKARGVLAVAVLIVALAGCSGTPDPAPTGGGVSSTPSAPTTTPDPTTPPPTTPAVAAPERPAAMDREDAEGAIAAAKYFISLYPYVNTTGDLIDWNELSDPQCEYCVGVTHAVESMVTNGSRIEGGAIDVTNGISFPREDATGIFPVDLELSEAPSREVRPDGSIIGALEGGSALAQIDLVIGSAGWMVRAVNTTDRPSQ